MILSFAYRLLIPEPQLFPLVSESPAVSPRFIFTLHSPLVPPYVFPTGRTPSPLCSVHIMDPLSYSPQHVVNISGQPLPCIRMHPLGSRWDADTLTPSVQGIMASFLTLLPRCLSPSHHLEPASDILPPRLYRMPCHPGPCVREIRRSGLDTGRSRVADVCSSLLPCIQMHWTAKPTSKAPL